MTEAVNEKQKLVKGYSENGLAKVLEAAKDMLERAARCIRAAGDLGVPNATNASYRKEASLCLAEAEELIAAVRHEARL